MSFSDVDEAIERANATEYRLGGSVWTKNVEQGITLASRLECSTAWVNAHIRINPHIPFGGAKMSVNGYLGGPWGLDELCQLQITSVARMI
jgi:acyl-CoA reductase-like NAD-dependent aldehyde dehydrogenase